MSDLISRSELTESIKRQYCTGCDNYNGSRCRACHADDMLSLVDDTADAQRWISVEERLPEECLYVIVYLQGRRNNNNKDIWHIDADYFEDGEWHRYPENGYYKPTHWMPLPEPPKEE